MSTRHTQTSRPSVDSTASLDDVLRVAQKVPAFKDDKVLADLMPRHHIRQIQKAYLLEKDNPEFDVQHFIAQHFYATNDHRLTRKTDPNITITQHISELWGVLERRNQISRGSLIGLPHPYIVPGGRFNEMFYWDSYFIMLGLAADGEWDRIEGMMKNFAYMLDRFRYIPNANRTYLLSRSQSPVFSQMVRLLATHRGQGILVEYLPQMLIEYRFWMKGRSKLSRREHKSYARVAEMPNGMLLNRYYDNKTIPRPESLTGDMEMAHDAIGRQSDRLFLHMRAAAESGWDFSSRWCTDPEDMHTIHTADIIPVDLNSLIYQLELTIADAYHLSAQSILSRKFRTAAERRARALQTYCWDGSAGMFGDYNFHHQVMTGRETLAGVFPMYTKIATADQAKKIAKRIETDFLKPGGLVTSLIESGQQWDAPNGWAPLHWIVIKGLRNYGHFKLANEIKRRWIKTNLKVFHEKRKLVEKYNVIDASQSAGGGEYPLQDGFGWTNGVLTALLSED